MSEKYILGLHHITAITADAQKNIDFYTKILGLKFTKLTVNFDDPSSYHLYFGDKFGAPGTALTFFAWPNGHAGRRGVDQANTIAFSIPENSMSFWIGRLTTLRVPFEKTPEERFTDNYLRFKDPDGITLELVADNVTQNPKIFAGYGVPEEYAIRGFYSITLWEDGFKATDEFLKVVMGYEYVGQSGNIFRYQIPAPGIGRVVDVRSLPDFWRGEMGTGIIHHVAFKTVDDNTQVQWHKKLIKVGADVSPIIDRKYFHSIYFHEPGGVLFEIATSGPGFTVDESEKNLGTSLQLPPQYEAHREAIKKVLPPVTLPTNE